MGGEGGGGGGFRIYHRRRSYTPCRKRSDRYLLFRSLDVDIFPLSATAVAVTTTRRPYLADDLNLKLSRREERQCLVEKRASDGKLSFKLLN